MARNKGQNSKDNPIRKGRRGPSSTGKRKPRVDQTNWRTKLQTSRVKFDDDQKEIFLRQIAEHGLKGRAAEAAGISMATVHHHSDIDPDFEEAYEQAMQTYRDTLADEVRRRGRDGWLEPVYNKDGRVYEQALDEDGLPILRHKDENRLVRAEEYASWDQEQRNVLESIMVPSYVRKFSDRMLELDIKRVDPSYRDKSSVDLGLAGGGVLLAPAGKTPEEAIAEGEAANEQARKERVEAEK